MTYESFPYGIFNQSGFDKYCTQQAEMQRQCSQNTNIAKMVKAISDYCEAARNVDADYQQAAMNACWAEIMHQIAINNGGQC